MLDLSLEEQFMAATTLANSSDVPAKEGAMPPAPEKYVPPQNGRSFVTLPEPDFFPGCQCQLPGDRGASYLDTPVSAG